jgi:hypothetical protein
MGRGARAGVARHSSYIIPSYQPDFLPATKFANALIKNGVTLNRATRAFEIGGRTYPADSLMVRTA